MNNKKIPYIKKKSRHKQSKVSKRISELQTVTQKKPLRTGRMEKRKWKLPSISLALLGGIILLLPSAIVLPFIDQVEGDQMAEADSDEPIELEEVDDSSLTVPVMRTQSEEIEQVPLETYVTRVIASEMPAEFEFEALKAQGVAARTYIVDLLLHHGEETDAFISDQTDDQVYNNDEELREIWGSDYSWKMEKLQEAVAETTGEIITYNEMTITPAYFSTSNGYTVNSEDYWDNELPYLRSVESKWDEESPSFDDQSVFTKEEIEAALNIQLPVQNIQPIEITETASERVDELTIGEHTFSGREIREKLDLKSTDFTIEQKNEHFVFHTKGYGHGIGMSQYGANGMAKEGKTYMDILSYYYNGIDVQTVDDIAPMLVQN